MYLSSLSVEYLRAEVTATDDPTIGSVEFAFTTTGAPTVWSGGSWETDAVLTGDYYRAIARILVGPAHVALPTGSVTVWVRTASSPESVVKAAGTLTVA